MDKPITLRIQEFQQNLSQVIADSDLPVFIIKYIIKDLNTEIDNLATDFANQEIAAYYESLNAEAPKIEEVKDESEDAEEE